MTFENGAELIDMESKAIRIASCIVNNMGRLDARIYAESMRHESDEKHHKKLWKLVERFIDEV
jgi:hypothetical protein